MNEIKDDVNVTKFDGKGALWTIAGAELSKVAMKLFEGILDGGRWCGGSRSAAAVGNDLAVLAMSQKESQKDSEIALLKAKLETRDEIAQVYERARARDQAQDAVVAGIDKRLAALETAGPLREQLVRQELDCCCKQMSSGLSSLTATVASITKLVIPNGAICPGWGAAEVTVKPATAAA